MCSATNNSRPDKMAIPPATFETDAPSPRQAPLARPHAALAPKPQLPPAAKTRQSKMPTRSSPPTLTSKTLSSRTPPTPYPKSNAALQRNLSLPLPQTIRSPRPIRMPPPATSLMSRLRSPSAALRTSTSSTLPSTGTSTLQGASAKTTLATRPTRSDATSLICETRLLYGGA